ncbi:MAG: ribonuclease J [Pseudomonadota bacterium]
MTKVKGGLHFLPLGGSGEIGMNLNLYEYEGKWLMVDCGVTFGNKLGIDVIMPDTEFIEKYRGKILGLVLTHGHEDHIGAVPYLWKRLLCPMYATPFTAVLVRGKLREAGLLDAAALVEVPIGGDVQLGPFDVEFITLTHSIPEPNALAIKTPVGTVIHTGDWKLDPQPLIGEAADEKRLRELGDEGVLALVCDSTNVFVEGRTASESEVRQNIIDLVKKQKNRVAIGLFASNVARLETCLLAAKASKRHVALLGRSLHRMYRAARESGYLLNTPDLVEAEHAMSLPRNKCLFLCTGSQGESRAALTRIANKKHQSVLLKAKDTVIFSSRQIPGNETAIGALQNALQSQGIEVIGSRDEFIHVSGHPARDELRDMYELIRPQILVPVHGEQIHMREQAELGKQLGIPKAIVPFNGSLIHLSPDNPKIIKEVHNGRLGYDGNRVVPFDCQHISDRSYLSQEGIVFLTMVINDAGEVDQPSLSFVGLAANKEEEGLLTHGVLTEIAYFIENEPPSSWQNDAIVQEFCSIAVRRTVRKVCGRKPMIVVHIIR